MVICLELAFGAKLCYVSDRHHLLLEDRECEALYAGEYKDLKEILYGIKQDLSQNTQKYYESPYQDAIALISKLKGKSCPISLTILSSEFKKPTQFQGSYTLEAHKENDLLRAFSTYALNHKPYKIILKTSLDDISLRELEIQSKEEINPPLTQLANIEIYENDEQIELNAIWRVDCTLSLLDSFEALTPKALLDSKNKDSYAFSQSNPYLKDWNDIGEFFASNYYYAPYSGTSRLSGETFEIKILESNPQFLSLGFSLERLINGGARIRTWGNEGSCASDEGITNRPPAFLYPLNAQKAEIFFPDFPQCKLLATRDSHNLHLEQEEQSKATQACAFLEQKCEFDVREESYIAKDYYKIKAGFDCTKAGTLTEKSICKDKFLANSDRIINILYLGAREHIKEIAVEEFTLKHNGQQVSMQNIAADKADLELSRLKATLQEELEKQKSLVLKKFLQDQREYLRERENCKGNQECIKRIMDKRENYLFDYTPTRDIASILEKMLDIVIY